MRLLLFSSLLFVSLTTGRAKVDQVTVNKLHAPEIIDPRSEKLTLKCDYDLHGNELYSVNWYKYDDVVFKYAPNLDEKAIVYPGNSFKISQEESNDMQLVILGYKDYRKNIEAYQGSYACEVAAEGTFSVGYDMVNVSAAVLPQSNPKLEGVALNYQVGEKLEAICTSMPSWPPAELGFYLNGHKIEDTYTRPDQKIRPISYSISSSRLSLSIPLERHHFHAGTLILECRATIANIPEDPVYRSLKTVTMGARNQRLAQELPRQSASASGLDKMASVDLGLLAVTVILTLRLSFSAC